MRRVNISIISLSEVSEVVPSSQKRSEPFQLRDVDGILVHTPVSHIESKT